MRKFLRLAFVLLFLAAPLCASTYTESAAASDLTTVQTCNAISIQSSLAPQVMVLSGPVAGSYSFSQVKSTTKNFGFYSPSGSPNLTSWPAGTWTVKLNVTTASGTNVVWDDTCVIRVNSTGVAQATVGSLTAQAITLSTTGVKSMAISGSAQTAAASDRIAVIVNFTNNATATRTWVLEAGSSTNDTVVTPLISAFTASLSETLSLSESIARVAAFGRGPSETRSVSDSVARLAGFGRGQSETQAVTDSASRSAGRQGILSETVALNESISRLAGLSAKPSETVTLNESIAGRAGRFASLSETSSVSDSIVSFKPASAQCWTTINLLGMGCK